jgi:hypothetical protein
VTLRFHVGANLAYHVVSGDANHVYRHDTGSHYMEPCTVRCPCAFFLESLSQGVGKGQDLGFRFGSVWLYDLDSA